MSTITFGLSEQKVAEPGNAYSTNDSASPTAQERWIEVWVDFGNKGSRNQFQAEPAEEQQAALLDESEAPLPEEQEEEKLYTYRIPPHLQVQPGDVLTVPVRNQLLRGIARQIVDQLPSSLQPNQIKEIEEIVVKKDFFPPTYWQLLEQVATYYQAHLVKVIRVALPGLLSPTQRRIRLIPDAIPAGADAFLNAPARQILQVLRASSTGDYTWTYLQPKIKGDANRGLKDLLQRGWVESYQEDSQRPRAKLQKVVTLIANFLPIDLTERQREALKILRQQGGEMYLADWQKMCNLKSSSIAKVLEKKGCIVISQREELRIERGVTQPQDTPKILNPYQAEALAVINHLSGFSQVLLHGVTGSGKTEIYLQAVSSVLARGQSALVLVPEIGLTPQLTDRFRARFGDKVCVYHSALSEGERYDTWRQMLMGTPQAIVGTRSAIFAPLPKLGLIVLDEEHDYSFKQGERPPLYHARTVAKWRAELENCPLILGSATPSLETWVQVKHSTATSPSPITHFPCHYLSLPERIYSRPLPPIEVVDMRQELRQGNRSIFSNSLQSALQQLQERQQQGILFIHRRGHSTFVSCRSCGYVMECPHCDVSLSYHQVREGEAELLRCHYCNYQQLQPPRCPECRSPYFKNFGSGTQRVEQELTRLFPQLRVIRFDSDTTARKGEHRRLLELFKNQEADILVGTQMVTKGLDLAQVTLVGVVSADGLLNMPDYGAGERAFQILTQVAGRAGRGNDPGQVIIQTYTPEHTVIQAVRRHEFAAFIEAELQERAALNYPPHRRLILLRLSGSHAVEVETAAHELASVLSSRQGDRAVSSQGLNYELLGPAPAPIMRVANRYRWHILLKLPVDAPGSSLDLGRLRSLCPRSVSLTIDVDPLNLG